MLHCVMWVHGKVPGPSLSMKYCPTMYVHTHTLIFWESEAKQKWLNFFVFMGDPLQVLLIMKLDLLSFFLRF